MSSSSYYYRSKTGKRGRLPSTQTLLNSVINIKILMLCLIMILIKGLNFQLENTRFNIFS